MTVDELIDLTEGLTATISLSDVRNGAPVFNDMLSDEQYVILVRFLAGERPTPPPLFRDVVHTDAAAPNIPRRERRLAPLDEDEAAERLAMLEELDEETPSGPIDLGDGVTLGI